MGLGDRRRVGRSAPRLGETLVCVALAAYLVCDSWDVRSDGGEGWISLVC